MPVKNRKGIMYFWLQESGWQWTVEEQKLGGEHKKEEN